MDWHEIAIGVIGLFTTAIGYLYNGIKQDVREAAAEAASVSEELTELKVKVAEEYVNNRRLDGMQEQLNRIENKLDRKADK